MRISICLLVIISAFTAEAQDSKRLEMAHVIKGNITPKSIIYDGNGRFFAQNMMYSHSITVYDRNYELVKGISDKVELKELGFPNRQGVYQGSPVEAAVSDSGRYVWVTNYRMYGEGFENPGHDNCGLGGSYDNSFIYRIDTRTLTIDAAIQVGSVPKYIAVTPDNRYALVTNWCSGDLSVIDISGLREMKRIPMGLYPRGIAIDSRSQFAYVAIMGSDKIARVDLVNFTVKMIHDVGKRPRHLCLSNDDKYLYASLNKEHKVVKLDLARLNVISEAHTGHAPRSMSLSADGQTLYVVNYMTDSLSVISATDMQEIQRVKTNDHPIGVACDPETGKVWVACYSGSIQIFNNVSGQVDDKPIAMKDKSFTRSSNYQYHIVVGVFRDDHNLKRMINWCVKAGYRPYVINPGSDMKKLSCMGFDKKSDALLELYKAKDLFGDEAWLLKQPMSSGIIH